MSQLITPHNLVHGRLRNVVFEYTLASSCMYWFVTWSFLVLSLIRCSILISAIIYATIPPLSFRKRTKNGPRRPCPFCGTFQLRLTRHLRLRHGNEKEVSDALGLPVSRRNEAFAIIRKNGMYKHNVEMMKSTECELLGEREQGKPKDLVVCGTSHGCYDRAYMWHHKRHCHSSEDTVSPPSIPVSLMRTSAAVSDHFKVDIQVRFVNDDVGRVCKTYPTILLLGQSLYAMVKQKPDKKSGVKSSVYRLPSILMFAFTEFQQHNPTSQGDPATSVDMLKRRNFPALEHAIEQYARSGGELKAGLKGALYYLLKKMAAAVKTDFIINQQDAKASEIEKFVVVLDMHHTSLFGDATYQVNVNRQTKLRGPQNCLTGRMQGMICGSTRTRIVRLVRCKA